MTLSSTLVSREFLTYIIFVYSSAIFQKKCYEIVKIFFTQRKKEKNIEKDF